MLSIIFRYISVRKISFLIYTIISVLLIWMLVAFFPSMQEQAQQFSTLLEAYPESFLKAFGVQDNLFLRLESFLATENFSLMWPILIIVMTISYASSAIAGEIESGTIEILLSQPVSRTKIFIAKYLSGFLLTLAFTFISILVVIPFAKLYQIEIQTANYFYLCVISSLFGLSIYSLTYMLSSIFSRSSLAASISAGLLILMYAADLASKLQPSLENLKYSSLFYYYDYSSALINAKLDSFNLFVFWGIILLSFGLGLICFSKRDITT